MRVRLMADYECYPLWEGEGIGNLDPWILDIPSDLAAAITAWGDQYDATLNREDPLASGFADESTAESWLLAGARLAGRLRDEGLTVEYFHEGRTGRDLVARR